MGWDFMDFMDGIDGGVVCESADQEHRQEE